MSRTHHPRPQRGSRRPSVPLGARGIIAVAGSCDVYVIIGVLPDRYVVRNLRSRNIVKVAPSDFTPFEEGETRHAAHA